ncbi:MAG: AtpZ/AtpI family protein [Acidimicrobiales bacterium]|nr:AtpZ/AtpI family protein [Acidimicrobiales bacterium]
MSESQWSEVNNALWRGHGGFELTLSPLLFGLLGWWIDRRLDTTPIFVITLAVLALVGVIVKIVFTYRYQMDLALEQAQARRAAAEADLAATEAHR